MFWGVTGYVAGLPVMAVAIGVTQLLSKWADVQPMHPIAAEFNDSLTMWAAVKLFVTASILAPVVEEILFRGALYGHVRRRWRPWLSAGVVAFIFAAIHPQGWAAIPILATIAVVLATLREWRGSLVASMTAHGLNNTIALTIGILATR